MVHQDLKSTNGTYLIRGDSKAKCLVASEPVELFASDIICLGATTRFMVWDVVLVVAAGGVSAA